MQSSEMKMSKESESLLPALVSAATPGPWDAGTSRLIGGPTFPTIWPRGRAPMCRLDLRTGVPKERNDADARLAALAPEMAALLIEARDALDGNHEYAFFAHTSEPQHVEDCRVCAFLERIDRLGAVPS